MTSSWLSRRDDRARLLTLLLLAVALASLQGLDAARVGLVGALLLCGVARLSPRHLIRRLWPLLTLLIPLWLLTPLYAPPGAVPLVDGWSWGPTDRGLAETGLITCRVLAVAMLAVVFLEAAPFDRTIQALQRLRVPGALVHLTLLTYRYLFELREDARRMQQALAARGFRPRPAPATAQVLATVSASLLVRSLARTERVEQAMRCRGYEGRLVFGTAPRGGLADVLLVSSCAALGGVLLAWDRGLL